MSQRSQLKIDNFSDFYQRLSGIVNSLSDPAFVIDTSGKVIAWNNAIEELSGMKSCDILGKDNYEYSYCIFGQRKPMLIDLVLKTDPDAEKGYEFLSREKDSLIGEVTISEFKGRKARLWGKATPLYDSGGNIAGAIQIIKEVASPGRKEVIGQSDSESRFKNFFEQSTDALYMRTREGHFVAFNDSMLKLFGYSAEEIKRLSVRDLYFYPEDCVKFSADLEKKGMIRRELSLRKKDGEKMICFVSSFLWKDPQGNILGYQGAITDITEQVSLEEEIRHSQDRYQAIVEDQTELICRWRPDKTLTFVNKASCKYMGLPPDKLIGRSILEFIPEDDWSKTEKDLSAFSKDSPIGTFEQRIKMPDGQVRWQRWILHAIYDDCGELVEFQAVGRDIMDVKLAEERYRMIFENSGTAIAIDNKDMKICMVNSEFLRQTGFTRDEIEGKNWTELIAKEDRKFMAEYHRKRRIDPDSVPNSYECRFINKGGQVRSIFMTVSMIPHTTDSIASIIDITDSRRAQDKIVRLNKELIKINNKLKKMSLLDHQTGLYNYRYLQDNIEAEFQRSRRYANSLSVIMIDVDYFKSINDVYGHKFGDKVIKQLAQIFKRMLRKYDLVIRSGGEEFVIVSPGTDKQAAIALARRVLDAVNLFNFGNKQHTVKLQMSLAVSSYPADDINKGMDLISLADSIIVKAKEDGGNRVYSSVDAGIRRKSLPKKVSKAVNVQLLEKKIEKLNRRSNQSLIEAVFAFAKTIELKDHYTGEHVERTVHYATGVARELGLPEEEIEKIRQAAILHDLGKIGISDKILLKKAKLTRREFLEIKKHPQIAVDIIRPIQFLHSVIPFILYHHEKWDGTGYPNGLKGDEIPVGARIIAISDVYQALISHRPYRKRAFSKKEALDIIKMSSGSQFDPKIVEVFLKVIKKIK